MLFFVALSLPSWTFPNLSLPSWKVVGLRLGEVLELGVRSANVSLLLVSFVQLFIFAVIGEGIALPQLPCPLLGMIGVRTVRCPPYRIAFVYHKLSGWYELFHSMHHDISGALTGLLRTPMDRGGPVYDADVGSQAVPVSKGVFRNSSWMLLEKLGNDKLD